MHAYKTVLRSTMQRRRKNQKEGRKIVCPQQIRMNYAFVYLNSSWEKEIYVERLVHTQICSNEKQSPGCATVTPHSFSKCVLDCRLRKLKTEGMLAIFAAQKCKSQAIFACWFAPSVSGAMIQRPDRTEKKIK